MHHILIGSAIVAALFCVAAAVASQRAFVSGQQAKPPTYSGGEPVEDDDSREGERAGGARERAALKAAALQTAATAFLVGASLVAIYAAVQTTVTQIIATLGAIIGVGFPAYRACRWRREDKRIEAQTEYSVITWRNMKSDEQARIEMTKTRPDLIRWLPAPTGE